MSPARKGGARRGRNDATGAQVATLNWAQRLDIIDALSTVLDGVYSHLTLKRSLYGFDAVRALEHLRQQLHTLTDLQFHRELTSLVNRLRDAHTQYQGPWTVKDAVATLPFLVEAYGPTDAPTYVVSKIDRTAIRDRNFVAGVTIDFWNGIPFDRAVGIHADDETGGRPDARRARALESLTFRSLEFAPPPDENFVIIGYRDRRGKPREVRLYWDGIQPGSAPTASSSAATRIRRGINPAAEAVRRAKKYRFNRKLWREERSKASARRSRSIAPAFADFLSSDVKTTRNGRFGYLRIWSFDVDDDDAFIEAATAHLRRLPDRGLIIDLRDNPGGFIWAAERLLQLFTPNQITPTRFALRATRLNSLMAQAAANQSELAPWAASLLDAQQTGEPFSSHLPITPPERCNDIGQRYGGPVVVIVDANTYSSGDLFAAGVVDNRIGPVVCIGVATGAGGANVWGCDDVRAALAAASSPIAALPRGVSFTVAVRRAVRSGDAAGTLIEDAGIAGQPYEMTYDDIFRGNRDLIEHCGELLATMPRTRMNVTRRGRTLTIETAGLDQLDIYVDGHPAGFPIAVTRDGRQRVQLPALAGVAEVVGFSEGLVRQRRRVPSATRH